MVWPLAGRLLEEGGFLGDCHFGWLDLLMGCMVYVCTSRLVSNIFVLSRCANLLRMRRGWFGIVFGLGGWMVINFVGRCRLMGLSSILRVSGRSLSLNWMVVSTWSESCMMSFGRR